MFQSHLQRGGSTDSLPSLTALTADQMRVAYANGERKFSWLNLVGADLHGANLQDCNFYGSDFTGANLSGVDLSRANLSHAKLTSANLRGANLSEAFLDQTDLTGADTTDVITHHPSSLPPPTAQPELQPVIQSPSPTADNYFCMYCGTALPIDANFCPVCGRVLPKNPGSQLHNTPNQSNGIASVTTPPPMFAPSSNSRQFGRLIGDYPGSAIRFIWIALWGAVAIYGICASLVQTSFVGILFWGTVGACCYAYYYRHSRHEVHAELFEYGFVISYGGKTTTARWEDIASVTHLVSQWRIYYLIPISYSHTYMIALSNGERLKVSSSFQNAKQLGNMMQQMWIQSTNMRRVRSNA